MIRIPFVAIPITDQEKEAISQVENRKGSIYALYTLSDNSEIEIGLLDTIPSFNPISGVWRETFKLDQEERNVTRLCEAVNRCYFASLIDMPDEIIAGRPVYHIFPSDHNTVDYYTHFFGNKSLDTTPLEDLIACSPVLSEEENVTR